MAPSEAGGRSEEAASAVQLPLLPLERRSAVSQHLARLRSLASDLRRLRSRRRAAATAVAAVPCASAPVPRHSARGVAEPSAREEKLAEDAQCSAGVRNPASFMPQWAAMAHVMQKLRRVIVAERDRNPELQGLTGLCGKCPCRQPPSGSALAELREKLAVALGLPPSAGHEHHPASSWRFRLVQAVQLASEDPDQEVGRWLEHGAPMGIACPIQPGGLFPAVASPGEISVDVLPDHHAYLGNHPSFFKSHGEPEPPAIALVKVYLDKGYGKRFLTRAAAEAEVGRLFPAPMGNLRKRKRDGTYKNRIIQDLKANGVNQTASTYERVVLPRGIDHAQDLAILAEAATAASAAGAAVVEAVDTLIIDYEDAFMSVPLHELERRFNCVEVPAGLSKSIGGWIVWKVLGFGGKPNPLVFGRVSSFASRSGQALLDPQRGRLQVYVDDPAVVVRGTSAARALDLDVVLAWWLALGLRLAWHKGSVTPGLHT